jgi:Ferritin-like domain
MVAGAAAALARPARAAAQTGEPAVLRRLIVREEAAADAQRSRAAPSVFALATDEDDHAAALRTELAALGNPQPAPGRPEHDAAARRLLEADGADLLDAAIALEASLLASYEQALRTITEPSILRTAATIMASHAQHHALLRLRAGLDPFP